MATALAVNTTLVRLEYAEWAEHSDFTTTTPSTYQRPSHFCRLYSSSITSIGTTKLGDALKRNFRLEKLKWVLCAKMPFEADTHAFCAAWPITNAAMAVRLLWRAC